MPSPRPLVLGILLCVAAIGIAAVGAGLAGPLDPSDPRPIRTVLMEGFALLIGILGGTMIAIWMGRKAAEDEVNEAEGPRPGSPP